MNDQQRMGLAVALCMGIYLASRAFAPPPPPQAPPPTSPVAAATPGPSPAAVPGPGAAEPAPPPVGATLPFSTAWGDGELACARAGLSALTLREYTQQEAAADGGVSPPLSLAGGQSAGGLQAQLVLPGGAEVAWRPRPNAAAGGPPSLQAEVDGRRLELEAVPRAAGYAIDYTLRQVGGPAGAGQLPLAFALRLSLAMAAEPERGLFAMFSRPQGAAPPLNALCAVGGRTRRLDAAEVRKKHPAFLDDHIGWAAIDRQHFVVAAAASAGDFRACRMQADDQFMTIELTLPPLVAGEAAAAVGYTLFLGPKRDREMAAVTPSLRDTLDYTVLGVPLGFLARPMVFLLHHFHALTHSWGAAIALLTLVVKALLFPVTYKSIISMRRMQAIKPQLDKLRETWAHDPERQSQEQLKMLRDNNANPLGGCLPAVLQMPVWLALYNMLRHAVDLYQQPFLWLTDLTLPEPFPVLALSVGVLTLVQQKMTPVAVDGVQAKVMMYLLPVMFTAFMFAMPSGLVVYILVNSVLTIAQQLAINRFSRA